MARGQVETPESYKKWLLNLIKDFRSPDKDNFENVVKSNGEQRKREYEDAKADAARTGDPKDIAYAKKLQEIVNIYEDVVKARELTDKAQALYNNIDANRKKIEALKALGEGKTEEAKKIQRQLTRARAGLQAIESERDVFGPAPKGKDKVAVEEAAPEVKAKPEVTTPAATTTTTPTAGTTSNKPAKNQPRSKTTATELARESGELYGSVKADDVAAANREATAEGIVSSADFGLSEALFKNVPSLKAIYEEYVNPKSKMTDDEFRKRIRNDVWYKQNSKEIKNRFVQLYNYQDLKKSGLADGSTDYEKQIAKIEDNLRKNAVILGSDIASNPSELTKIAENLYITDRSEDDSFITDLLAARIRPVGGTIGGKGTANYSGQALQNYNALVKAARDNGFQVSDIIPGGSNVDQLLQNIAAGKIDINRVISDARTLASQGQPQYVRDLLAQGYNLNQVYAPYRQTMANILEIGDPDQIDLNDPLLRTAITDKGDMNLYDFKKALRQDNRWQYTGQAKEDVSNAAFKVLKDFGFQG